MSNSFSLNNKVVLVTGAGAGIGRAIAKQLAGVRAQVMLSDIDSTTCAQACDELSTAGCRVASHAHDVTSEDDWKRVLTATVSRFNGLDVLVNNAGIYAGSMLLDSPIEQYRRLNKVNVESVFLGMKLAAEIMKIGGTVGNGGSIINMSSVAGLKGVSGDAAYGATKGAVRLCTKHLAVEFARLGYGIRVNSVHPGLIATDMGNQVLEDAVASGLAPDFDTANILFSQMIPMGHFGSGEDVANMVQFLASDASKYCTGAEFVVDGGLLAG